MIEEVARNCVRIVYSDCAYGLKKHGLTRSDCIFPMRPIRVTHQFYTRWDCSEVLLAGCVGNLEDAYLSIRRTLTGGTRGVVRY